MASNWLHGFAYGARAGTRKAALAAALLLPIPAVAETTTLAALGDSLVHGYGLPQEQGFVPQLEAWLRDNGHDVRIINAGVSGDTTAGGLARIGWTLTPDVNGLIVSLGANDMLRGIDPEASRDNLRGILKTAQQAGVEVLLIGFQAPGNYGPAYKTSFDSMYPDLAEEFSTRLAPSFFEGMTQGDDPAAAARFLQPDGLHPSAEGVARIVEAIGPYAETLLEQID